MIQNSQDTLPVKLRRGYWLTLAVAIFVVGIVITVYAVKKTDAFLRASLLSRAQSIAAGVHDDTVAKLTGSPADIGTEDYNDIKQGMVSIQKANADSRFVYLMGWRDKQLFFFADSEPPDSKDYSAPGDVYKDASAFKVKNALAGVAFTEGPYQDVWGTWISGYAPVYDPALPGTDSRGKIIATAGIDISAKAWQDEIAYAAALPASIALFLLLILGLYYHSRKHELKHTAEIENEREKLHVQQERLRTLYAITAQGELSVADQLRAAVAAGAKALHTGLGVLSRIEGPTFTVVHCYDANNGLHEGDIFKLAETYCDITVKKNEVVAIDDMIKSPYSAHACYSKFKLESYIGVPVIMNGEPYGTLAFLAPEPHHPGFNDSDRDFIRLMGRWVSSALEREILRQKEIEVNNMKSEFVSVASHQLRTPLTGIRWFGELLLKGKAGEMTADQKDFVQQMYDSNTRMINLVNDLLNVSRIETGKKFTIEKKPVAIVPIIDSLFTELVALAAEHKVTLKKAADFPTELTLTVDGEKIRQVLQNLLSNAVKYSKAGGVVEIACELSDIAKVVFSVKDSGLGIPAKQQSRMFEKFFRADNVQTKETDGTGLGLYIAKAIVEGHGGKISFTSEENKGTTFVVILPR